MIIFDQSKYEIGDTNYCIYKYNNHLRHPTLPYLCRILPRNITEEEIKRGGDKNISRVYLDINKYPINDVTLTIVQPYDYQRIRLYINEMGFVAYMNNHTFLAMLSIDPFFIAKKNNFTIKKIYSYICIIPEQLKNISIQKQKRMIQDNEIKIAQEAEEERELLSKEKA